MLLHYPAVLLSELPLSVLLLPLMLRLLDWKIL